MAFGYRGKRFTIYDAMESKGVFEANPANPGSRGEDGAPLYRGPVQYPKMLYHPKGETEIIVAAEVVMTPFGPKEYGEQRQLKHVIVRNRIEEDKYVAEGWHATPALAIAASGKEPPPTSPTDRIAQLEAEIARLRRDKDAGIRAPEGDHADLSGEAAA